jgi:hypothetical protein
MLMSEVLLAGGAVVGAPWLWRHEHPVFAVALGGFAALTVVSVVTTAVSEKRPWKELLGAFAVAVLGAGYLSGLAWACWGLWSSGNSGWAVLAGIVGLWGVPLGLAFVLGRFRGEA